MRIILQLDRPQVSLSPHLDENRGGKGKKGAENGETDRLALLEELWCKGGRGQVLPLSARCHVERVQCSPQIQTLPAEGSSAN